MEEQPLAKKQMNKKSILPIVVIIIVLITLAFYYNNQITNILTPLISNKAVMLDQPTCTQRMTNWCNQCLSANAGRKDFWNIAGAQSGSDLATCWNNYFGTDIKPEQDCTGNALVYCSQLLNLQVE